jgi:hypothetical protein
MKMEHTQEPWSIKGGSEHIIMISEIPLRYAILNGPDGGINAARIVACVNACAGMENPTEEISKLKADNEALRKELATPIMVQTNRLVDALADARADNKRLAFFISKEAHDLAESGFICDAKRFRSAIKAHKEGNNV